MERAAVVVGAGVGGLSAAVGLHRAGWTVTVLERWPAVVGTGAGLAVWPDAQQALDRLGVGEAFRERAVDFGDAWFFTASGRRLAPLPRRRIERQGGGPVRILARTDLMDILAGAAAGVDVLTDTDVVDRPDLLDRADVVIGADGLRSAVRQSAFAGETAAPRYAGVVAWRGRAPFELDAGDYGETWGDGCLVGLTRLAPGQTNWYAAVPEAGLETAGSLDDLRDRLAAWRPPIPEVLAASDPQHVLRNPVYDLAPHLRRYVTAQVALVGDAAHAMTPNLGRGACEAILDADDLVTRLTSGADVATSLAAYDRARRGPTRRAVVRSRQALAVAITRHTAVRDTVMRALSPALN